MRIESARSAVGTLVFLALGPIVWALHFTLVYASQSTMCTLLVVPASAGNATPIGWTVGAIVATSVAMLLLAMVRPLVVWRLLARRLPDAGGTAFGVSVMRWLSMLSLLAMLYTLMALFTLPSCA
jgi:hypothetical protein